MRATPSEYAKAYLAALGQGAEEGVAVKRLAAILLKNGDRMKAMRVAEEIERFLVARAGGRMVRMEFAREVDSRSQEKLASAYSPRDRVSVALNPKLLAGVRIITNGEEELDVSLQGKLRSLLGN